MHCMPWSSLILCEMTLRSVTIATIDYKLVHLVPWQNVISVTSLRRHSCYSIMSMMSLLV